MIRLFCEFETIFLKSNDEKCSPPGDVQASTNLFTLFGKRVTRCWATIPPKEMPITLMRFISRLSKRDAASSA